MKYSYLGNAYNQGVVSNNTRGGGCAAAVCGGNVGCAANACGGAACGANACGGDACGAAACAANACAANACLKDACAINILPIPGPFDIKEDR